MSAADRARAERRAQGLPDVVEDVAVYAMLARLLVAATSGSARTSPYGQPSGGDRRGAAA